MCIAKKCKYYKAWNIYTRKKSNEQKSQLWYVRQHDWNCQSNMNKVWHKRCKNTRCATYRHSFFQNWIDQQHKVRIVKFWQKFLIPLVSIGFLRLSHGSIFDTVCQYFKVPMPSHAIFAKFFNFFNFIRSINFLCPKTLLRLTSFITLKKFKDLWSAPWACCTTQRTTPSTWPSPTKFLIRDSLFVTFLGSLTIIPKKKT